jgi:hypothetical protein
VVSEDIFCWADSDIADHGEAFLERVLEIGARYYTSVGPPWIERVE